MERDLTIGKPSKVLFMYCLPLFGSIIFQQLYNLADSFVAGRYIGTEALAAVGNSYEITLVFIAIAFGCNIGTSVVAARHFGMKDIVGTRSTIYTALISSAVIGVILTIIGFFSVEPLLQLINTSEEIFSDSLAYIRIYIGGYLFLLIYNVSTGIFSSLGDSRTPFWFLAASSVSNVILDVVFVKYCNMGVSGVAWATFICQGVSGILAFIVVMVRLRKLRCEEKPKAFAFCYFKELLVIAVPSVLQQLFVSVGNIILQGFINSFGTAATGGYAAAIKYNNLAITSVVAVGNGMSNYTAQNVGAGKPQRIKEGLLYGEIIAASIILTLMTIYLTASTPLIKFFITDGNEEAVKIGVQFFRIVSPFYITVAIKLVIDGILRGTKKMVQFMISTFTDLALRVGLSAILVPKIGLIGIWWSWPIGWGVAVVISLSFYIHAHRHNFGFSTEKTQIADN